MEIKKNMVFEYCDKDDYMKYFIPKKYNAEAKSWWGLLMVLVGMLERVT